MTNYGTNILLATVVGVAITIGWHLTAAQSFVVGLIASVIIGLLRSR